MQIHDLNTGTPASGHYLAMDSGTDTYKATPGNIKPAYTTGDSSTATSWTSVTAVATGLSFSTLINRITTMMKNVRYLYNVLGSSTFSTVASTITGAIGNTALGTTATTLSGAIAEHESDLGNTDISGIGDGTVTGAISTLNTNLGTVVSISNPTTTIPATTTTNVGSINLSAGTWIICASVQFTSGFSEVCLLSIGGTSVTGVVRGVGTGGGGLSTSIIHTSSSAATLTMQVYQGSSASKTINQVQFKAIRIK